jgi:hypothetical protein
VRKNRFVKEKTFQPVVPDSTFISTRTLSCAWMGVVQKKLEVIAVNSCHFVPLAEIVEENKCSCAAPPIASFPKSAQVRCKSSGVRFPSFPLRLIVHLSFYFFSSLGAQFVSFLPLSAPHSAAHVVRTDIIHCKKKASGDAIAAKARHSGVIAS